MHGCNIELIYKYSSNNATGTYTDIRETVGSYSMVGDVIIVSFELLGLLIDIQTCMGSIHGTCP